MQESSRAEPRRHLWTVVREEVLRHVEDARGGVDGYGAQAREVVGRVAGSAAFGSAPEAVWLELSRGGALAVHVHGPEREVTKEVVPPQAAQPPELLLDGGEARRQRGEVRDEHRLQLHVCVEAHTFEQVGHESLIWVECQASPQYIEVEVRLEGGVEVERLAAVGEAVERPPAVPDEPARPLVELAVAYREGRRSVAADVLQRDPCFEG